jgi:hypothetical protein
MSFTLCEGDRTHLEGVRYVVTLDVDTVLPKGALARLVGTLAHPLNRAEFDDVSGRVRTGYTVVQPRVEISPECGNRSRFARWFTGDTAIDIYSRAVSDVYQDLFGSGIYVGKGVYDVEAFRRSLEGRVPERAAATTSSKASMVAPRSRRIKSAKPFPGSISNSPAASIDGSVATGSSFRGSGDPCRPLTVVVFAMSGD